MVKNILKIFVLFLIFIVSCSKEKNVSNITEARKELKNIASKINKDFQIIEEEVGKLADFTANLYKPEIIKQTLKTVDKTKYKLHSSGVLYRDQEENVSAAWVTRQNANKEKVQNIVYFTEPLEEEFIRITQKYPEVVQTYYNDKYSYNRIYPFVDGVTQFASSMDIAQFNFYYLADGEHNPERKPVWVDEPYVDPAGRGWMVSAVAPVYVEDELVGVPGLDVTINTITERYIHGNLMNLMILDKNGVVVATNVFLSSLFSLPPLKDHKYLETIKMDTYKSENYNLLISKSPQVREIAKEIYEKKKNEISFQKEDHKYLILVEEINALNWFILKVLQ